MSDARIPGAFLRPGTSSFSDFLAENAPDLLPARRSLPAGATGAVSAYIGPFHEACERQVREQLSPADFRAAAYEGRSLTLDEPGANILDEHIRH